MYFLDLSSLYRTTKKSERIIVRKQMSSSIRDIIMQDRLISQRFMCYWCGDLIDMSHHLDHIIPIYRGGDNRRRNLVASCRSCNLTKGVDQIEIKNEYTIKEYKKLIEAYDKWNNKVLRNSIALKYLPRRVQLYHVYRADLFKKI